jgi:hypothetical protein
MSLEHSVPRVRKFSPIPNEIIVTNGVWGCGKSLLNPIVSSLDGVQQVRYDLLTEQICILAGNKKITADAAGSMLQSHLGEMYYSNLIGRHLNFRWKDHSGLGSAPNKIRRVREIFREEGDLQLSEGLESHAALHIMTHNLLSHSDILFDIFDDRIKFIELVRHPLDVLENWSSYQSSFSGMRETTLSFDIKGTKVPWFLLHEAQEYLDANNLGKSILGIVETYRVLLNKARNSSNGNRKPVLFIAFEDLERITEKTLTEICSYLNREPTRYTGKVMRRLGLPRELESLSFEGDSGRTRRREQNLRELRHLINESYFEKFCIIIQEYEEFFY